MRMFGAIPSRAGRVLVSEQELWRGGGSRRDKEESDRGELRLGH